MQNDRSARPQRTNFLASLPERDRERLVAIGRVVAADIGTVLHESGKITADVCFPIDCVASLTATMQDGAEAEVAIIGPEGVVGVTAAVGGTDTTWNDSAIQIGGEVLRVPLELLRRETTRSPALRLLLQRYAQALLVQTSQIAACNRFHSIEQRLGRCLLALHDRVATDDIPMTHERLAALLGSLRPGVTLAVHRLQELGSIRSRRGHIEISDRDRLAGVACECYQAVASEYDRLLGADAMQQLTVASTVPDETLREVNSRLMAAAIREQRAHERAEEANDVTTHFFATLSHELRTPLTAILGWSDVLQSREFDDETLQLAIETIHRNAETQKRLVNDMLDLARLRAGKLPLHFEPLDITAAVRTAVASSRPAADASAVAISMIAGDPVTTNADPVRLYQILSNLLTNAVKFTPPGGSIEVAVVTTPSDVQIGVRDNGRGIEPELLPHVFEDFRQGPAAPSGELGMGLGLAIVQQLVRLHGGAVSVQSPGAGRGTTFTVVLPRLDR
ncbi:MAG TPA: ATP-binding protein [Thermoanaerobaculia bacterium]|jgi:signal transduction histidine kinase